MSNEKKDVIVIGSGIGGSGIAALLAHRGFNVTLLERLNFIGGRCCSRERDGFILDLGVHTFSQAGAGALGEILRKCDKDDQEMIKWSYTKDPTQKLSYLGEQMVDFPKHVGKLGANSDIYMNIMHTIVKMSSEEIDLLYNVSLKEWIDRFTKDEVIHNIFIYISELYFIVPYWETPAGEFIRSMQDQAKKRASGYPEGGCSVIPGSYIKVLEENGGKLRTGVGVKKILIENGKAIGVETTADEILKADIIISNVDPKRTTELAGADNFPADYMSQVRGVKYTPGAYLIRFALKKKITDEKFVMHIANKDSVQYLKDIEAGKIPERVNLMIPVISNFDPGCAPAGHQLIIAGTFPAINPDWDKWHESVFNTVKDVFPDIEENILFIEGFSPKELDGMMGEGGSLIGMAQTVDQIGEKRLQQKTPIKNLYLVGAEAGGWGIGTELAANSALELNDMI